MELKFGCDPELGVWDNKLGRVIPANGLVPGTKDEPHALDGGMVQIDGTAVEFGTDPATSGEEWAANISKVLAQVRGILDAKEKGRYKLVCGSLLSYHDDDVKSLDKEVFRMGCSPDFTLKEENGIYRANVVNKGQWVDPKNVPIGGHIHLGLGDCNMDVTDEVLVTSVGRLLKVVNGDHYFGDATQVYQIGRARVLGFEDSAHPVRIKPYGVELRKWSSIWLNDPTFCSKFVDYAYTCLKILKGGRTGNEARADLKRMWEALTKAEVENKGILDVAY